MKKHRDTENESKKGSIYMIFSILTKLSLFKVLAMLIGKIRNNLYFFTGYPIYWKENIAV